MPIIKEYLESNGQSPFAKWFEELNSEAAAKITVALYKLEQGNFSRVEGVGEGVFEYKLDFGPGYTIYFGKDNIDLIILLCGGHNKETANFKHVRLIKVIILGR